MDAQSLGITRFDIAKELGNDRLPPVIIVIGRRRAGKSFMVRDIYRQTNMGLPGLVISNCESGNVRDFYRNVVPEAHIHEKYSSAIVQAIIDRNVAPQIHTEEKDLVCSSTRTCLVVEDSVLVTVPEVWDASIREVWMNGRHLGISMIVALQYPIEIDPALRANVDYVFIIRDNILSFRRRIYDRYAQSVFSSFEEFCTALDATTSDYSCMVIKMHGSSNELSERVFWYKV